MAPNDGPTLKDDNGHVTTSSSSDGEARSSSGGSQRSTVTNGTDDSGESHSRLDDLADEAAKQVNEFTALLADVETRTRNQRVLLERHYENLDIKQGSSGRRPTTLSILGSGQRPVLPAPSHCPLKVDELMDFGPLSKKLKKNAAETSPVLTSSSPNFPSGRRFSTFAASLPRAQYGRKASMPPVLLSPPSARNSSVLPAVVAAAHGSLTESSSSHKVNGDTGVGGGGPPPNTVGGLVKLFSETAHQPQPAAGQGSLEKPSLSERKRPIPPLLRPPPCNSPPSSARLLVRGPEKVVFCSDPMSPLANGPPLSPRVTSPTLPPGQNSNNAHLTVKENATANRSRTPSPSFSSSFFFGKNNSESPQKQVLTASITDNANVKRSSSPSSFPNPFAFARKFSGAFTSENEKAKKARAERPLSPELSGRNDVPLVPVNPYVSARKPKEPEKQTIFQRRSSVNPVSPYRTGVRTSPPSGKSSLHPAGQGGNGPEVVYRSMSQLNLPECQKPENPERSTSPSSFFGFNKSIKKDKSGPSDVTADRNRAESNLERLLAGLNFSKFRLTDRLGMGSTSSSSASSAPTMAGTSQQAVDVSAPGVVLTQFPVKEPSSGVTRSSMTRTVSQPSGLSNCLSVLIGDGGGGTDEAAETRPATVQLRRDRARVTLSEDRTNLAGSPAATSTHSPACLLTAGASSERVSEDIASLITDIRQHFRLRKRSERSSPSTPSAARDSGTKNEDDACVAVRQDSSNRDSDYVVSLASASDCDYAELTSGHDETGEVDTESTSSSFIFSPTASSTTSRAALLERDSFISGPIQSRSQSGLEEKKREITAHHHHHHSPQPTGGCSGAVVVDRQSHSAASSSQKRLTNVDSNSAPAVKFANVVSSSPYNSRVSSAERSMTFPPSQTRKNSVIHSVNTLLPLPETPVQPQNPPQPQSGPEHQAWDSMDDPENRLSSASFPESAISLSDSVYSTAGSTSLSSYIDTTSMSDSSSIRPTLLSDCSDASKDSRSAGKARYHSDPMTTTTTTQVAEPGSVATPHSSISEPILPNGNKSLEVPSGKSGVPSIPHSLKDVMVRESGSAHFSVTDDNSKDVGTVKGDDMTVPVQQKDYRGDSFRRSEKRLPRGPFGARLEEDQMRREQRQLVQDLSFLHDSPASTPGLPELSPSLPTSSEEKMPRRRQSAAPPQTLEKVTRQYVAVRSSPDLFRAMSHSGGVSPLSPPTGLRVADIHRSVSDAQGSSWKKITEETDSAVYSGSSDSVPTIGSGSQLSTKGATDFRTHIVRELYDTENSYVESLQILEKYYSTLKKNEDLVEKTLSENMFYQIPSIKQHHESLLTHLKHRIEQWDARQKIGDLIVDTFTKEAVIDTYTAFINNWKTAKEAIKLAKTTRPCFVRCLEEWTREHRGKLNLDALLIMPVQRIPRYELLIKELLKHTPEDHPDRVDLETAQNELHDLALKINAMEHEVDEAERMMIRLKELEMYIDGLSDLVEPNRKFLKFDMVTMSSGMGMKKDRCLFLFSDLLIITNLKRKSGTTRKPSTHSCSPQLYPTLEMNKYKLLMRVSLEDLELAKPTLITSKKPYNERELLEGDLGVLSKISDLTSNLAASHGPLDDAVRSMMAQVSRQLAERQSHATNDPALSKVELTVATQNGLETVSVTFLTPTKRNAWERAFLEAKQALTLTIDRRPPPDFLNPIPIRKTRAGLQLTCIATTSDLNAHDMKDVWVCNSDGYVGQVCVLSMQPEPALTSCVAVSNCKITCIASVASSATILKNCALLSSGNISPISDHSSDTNDPCITMELNSDDSSDEDNSLDEHSRSCPSDKETFPMSLSEDEMAARAAQHHTPDPTQGTMWIGMEDGRIFVYYCNDNIRIRKPRIKIQLPSSVHCITSTEHTVLVGLGNGQVAAFHRPAQGFWETLHPTYVDLGQSTAPVQHMIVVCGRLWCASLNVIHVINLSTLTTEVSFPAVADSSRNVTGLVSSGLGVWVSVQNSVVLRLCNALTYEFVADLNLTPSVQKMLAGCDEILRQHKFACLRVTAMLTCKDLLWVGTSAGVIMTINLPHIVQGMAKLSSTPTVTGIWHGHTGQVRFLHCLEQNPNSSIVTIPSTRRSIRRERRHSLATTSTLNKMIVISGGDGYEDFRYTSHPATTTAVNGAVDHAGRDDSTNHLLLWHC